MALASRNNLENLNYTDQGRLTACPLNSRGFIQSKLFFFFLPHVENVGVQKPKPQQVYG